MSTMLPHEKYTRARILTGLEAVDLVVNEDFGISVELGKGTFQFPLIIRWITVGVWVGIFQFG